MNTICNNIAQETDSSNLGKLNADKEVKRNTSKPKDTEVFMGRDLQSQLSRMNSFPNNANDDKCTYDK